ncbi:uncharacterized protein LOC135478083, partial [Liolophura sinensis]|uniref:uncharacterized protein LOC135478083 n=1 Tax=Liolophura sinensis TaxID=3198878 RepID=UPI003158DF67
FSPGSKVQSASVQSVHPASSLSNCDKGSNERSVSHVEGNVSPSSSPEIHPRGKFKSWLSARASNSGRGNSERGVLHSKTITHPEGGETNLLMLDSARSVECATPDPEWSRDQVLGPASTSRSDQTKCSLTSGRNEVENILLPDQFETLADKIISRVKQDLDLNSKPCRHFYENKAANRTTTQEQNPANNSSGMTSHNCPLCRQVMLSPDQIPMLLSPCGHSLCGQCVKGRELCPCCNNPISSIMANIMLQQIIDSFYQGKAKVKVNEPEHTRQYQSSLYTENNCIHAGMKYREKYSNLRTRHEVLMSERSTIHKDLNELSQETEKEMKQLRNIENAEDKLTNEIARIQTQLNDLRGHKEEYKVKVTELEARSEERRKKLSLLEEIVRGVQMEMEKVLLLAEETGQ